MDQMASRIDHKLNTITKLQTTFRQKQFDYAAFLSGNRIDLPPVASVLVSFPNSRRERAEVKNTPKRRNIIELDRFLEDRKDKATSDELNRIIFASPVKNRLTFQRTFFRSSIYYTIQDRGKQAKPRQKEEEKKEKEEKGKALTPLQGKQQKQKTPKLTPQEPQNPSQPPERSVLDCNPQLILQRRRKDHHWRKTNALRLPNLSVNLHLQRYSPWRNDELQEQLIL